ncbi:hypothetical protein CDD83_5354 [Cordyceps sp. RAO-2017]|nr:hypothetical protein CDD83_5354 [Cordyceps sp. RAO-2017]
MNTEKSSLAVRNDLPHDCDDPLRCQSDAPILRDEEFKKNICNKCGRTKVDGNIDIAKVCEEALANGTMAKCNPGDEGVFKMNIVNTDGGGPYVVQIDETNNAGQFTKNIDGENGLEAGGPHLAELRFKVPSDMDCKGGSTGNMCAFRARNVATAGTFGGCACCMQDKKDGIELTDPSQILTQDKPEDVAAEQARMNVDVFEAVEAEDQRKALLQQNRQGEQNLQGQDQSQSQGQGQGRGQGQGQGQDRGQDRGQGQGQGQGQGRGQAGNAVQQQKEAPGAAAGRISGGAIGGLQGALGLKAAPPFAKAAQKLRV